MIGILAVLITAFTQVSVCLAAPQSAASELKSIRVVLDDNYPPYVFKDEQGVLKGITVDQWRLWEKKTGIRAELSGMDWSEAQRRMEAGEFDVIDTIFRNEKREKLYDFTKPYAVIPVPLFFHKDISGIRGAEDLKDFLVGAKAGDNVLDALRKKGVTNIAEYPSYEKIVEAARDGRVKVFTVDRPPAFYYLNKMGIQGNFRETKTMYSGEFHRAVKKGKSGLLATVENGFAAISAAEYRAIDKRWLGSALNSTPLFRYAGYVAAVVAVLMTLLLVWLATLKRSVKVKTMELAASEERYRSIIQNLQDVYYRTDADGRLVMISPSGVELLGYENAEEMLGTVVRDTFYHDPEERDAFLHNLKIKGHLYGYEVTLKRKDGTPVPVATSTHLMFDPDGNYSGVEGVFRDIGELKKNLDALDYANECFQQALSTPQHVLYRLNVKKGCYDYLSPAIEILTGYPQEQFLQMGLETVAGYLHPVDREKLLDSIKRGMSQRNSRTFDIDIEYRFKRANGVYCWVRDSATACLDQNWELECIFGSVYEISERKHTEELLKESEERYRLLVEQSTAWIWRTDADIKHTYSNDNVERILGYSVDQFYTMNTLDLVHPDDHKLLGNLVDESILKKHGWSGLVLRWLAKDGTWRFIESCGAPIFNENDEFIGLQGVDTDITDRLQLEQELEKSQRLESLGLLAGGIAHDFNNILTGIVGNLSLARMMVDESHRAAGRLAECEKAARRASELTQQLLTFSRGGEPVKKVVDLSRLISESVSFALHGANVKGRLEIAADLWSVNADEGQLSQVLNNLLINAIQAMPDGGTVTVTAENLIEGETPGESDCLVRLSIRDSGVGIPPGNLQKVFDPYFTTKTDGTGLGLASVYSIINRHNGSVNVSSQVGQGTEFVISLPAVCIAAGSEQESAAVPISGIDECGRVLIMDDEPMIIDVLTMMLAELGCVVDASCDGAEAVSKYRAAFESELPYDVVILDLTVPGGMGGLDASRLIREIDPEASLIVSSGYSQDSVVADFREYGFSGAVMKPYAMSSLCDEFKRVMATRRPLSSPPFKRGI